MRTITKEKITLCLLIGLFVFTVGTPLMTTGVVQGTTLEKHDSATTAYTPHDAIYIHSNAEMIAQATAESWPGNGSEVSPYQITGYSFYDQIHSIEIRNIDLHWEFTDNYIDGPYDETVWCGMEITNSTNGYVANNVITGRFRGLWLIDIYDVTITNNLVHDNLFNGIECVGFINGCLISDNTVTGTPGSGIVILTGVDSEISRNNITDCDGSGIQLTGTSTNCQITDNIVNGVGSFGIQLRDSTSADVMHNVISNADEDGIYIFGSEGIEIYNNSIDTSGDDGIVLNGCNSGLIHNNSLTGSEGIGIFVQEAENSIIKFNHVEDSTEYGLETAADAEYVEITRNVFINNSAAVQVCDEGENNTYIYNYYDDWVSPDADSDLIVDSPYVIDGDTENEDPYPLADPDAVPPTIDETTTTGTGESESVPIPMEMILIAGGAVVIILVGVFVVKRKT